MHRRPPIHPKISAPVSTITYSSHPEATALTTRLVPRSRRSPHGDGRILNRTRNWSANHLANNRLSYIHRHREIDASIVEPIISIQVPDRNIMASTDTAIVARIQAAEAITLALLSKTNMNWMQDRGEGSADPEKLGDAAARVFKIVAQGILDSAL